MGAGMKQALDNRCGAGNAPAPHHNRTADTARGTSPRRNIIGSIVPAPAPAAVVVLVPVVVFVVPVAPVVPVPVVPVPIPMLHFLVQEVRKTNHVRLLICHVGVSV